MQNKLTKSLFLILIIIVFFDDCCGRKQHLRRTIPGPYFSSAVRSQKGGWEENLLSFFQETDGEEKINHLISRSYPMKIIQSLIRSK